MTTLPRPVVIDTDPGVDDALALMLALRSPELRVELITRSCMSNVRQIRIGSKYGMISP